MEGRVVGVLRPLCPWVGFVLDKQDVPKDSSGFSSHFHDQYAMRLTGAGQGCAVRIVPQWTSSVVISASPAYLEPPCTLKTPARSGQAEWRMRLCRKQCVLCPVLPSATGPGTWADHATLGANLEAGVPELKSLEPHAQLVSELNPGSILVWVKQALIG